MPDSGADLLGHDHCGYHCKQYDLSSRFFTIPGMGSLLISSISNRDYPVVLGIIVLIAALVVVINFIVDLLYSRIDPRIRIRE